MTTSYNHREIILCQYGNSRTVKRYFNYNREPIEPPETLKKQLSHHEILKLHKGTSRANLIYGNDIREQVEPSWDTLMTLGYQLSQDDVLYSNDTRIPVEPTRDIVMTQDFLKWQECTCGSTKKYSYDTRGTRGATTRYCDDTMVPAELPRYNVTILRCHWSHQEVF